MRGQLAGDQPETLNQLVALVQASEGVFPTIERLATALHIGYDAARARLRRLRELGFVVALKPNVYALNDDLCTEPETARFLLIAHELAMEDPEGRIAKGALRRKWKAACTELHIEASAAPILDACVTYGYLGEIVSARTYVRPTERLLQQLAYLTLRAQSRVLAQ
ncbi:hypothetical protein KAW64_14060 [bacterium]|nr:hypothetical protein [bacterium]